ncbi:hypothetical protein D9756_010878 [Leucocoprinus leucothites]|uniref:Survival protein SurE-like phosphatase/nucleotidase domain-containing protein n=1 Tax=Leucocoprinus leucothites TaxID=201217 RepID=A0A8H5FQV7_9AGAR|nr:hypothetical protein D9756_010878 [Leucoagaricus leucothites]
MGFATLLLFVPFLSFVSSRPPPGHHHDKARTNILVTNDDGWATAQIRSEFDALEAAGFNLVLSCPADNRSGTGNSTATPAILAQPCEFNTCPAGAPATGFNATDPRLNYVNAFPRDATNFGINTLAPKFFKGKKPDLVVAGSNIGNNLGTTIQISGTDHAAMEAANLGVPAIAFSGATGSQVSYTALETDPTSAAIVATGIYNKLTVRLVETLLKTTEKKAEILPPRTVVNVNYPSTTNCSSAEHFKWVFTRTVPAPAGTVDVDICRNGGVLVDERTAFAVPGCWVTVSVFSSVTLDDVDAATQRAVVDVLKPLLRCQHD